MYTIYVDESGIPSFRDPIKHYVLSGILVHDSKIKELKQNVFLYKHRYFKNDYIESEIHTQNLYNSKKNFIGLVGRDEKYQLLDNLYKMITDLSAVIISVAIDKPLLEQTRPNWKIFKIAWTILISRFNQYLEYDALRKEPAIVKIDKSTSKNRKDLNSLFEEMRSHKHKHQRIDKILGEPIFVNSDAIEGIQVADAVSYCTNRYLEKKSQFTDYWKMITKIMLSKDGKTFGHGLNIFPYDHKMKNRDTQP